jgi:integration host factor subunit beta
MNKSDLVKALQKDLDLPIRKAEEIVDTMFQYMSRTLLNGDRIEIRGFGSFVVKDYPG